MIFPILLWLPGAPKPNVQTKTITELNLKIQCWHLTSLSVCFTNPKTKLPSPVMWIPTLGKRVTNGWWHNAGFSPALRMRSEPHFMTYDRAEFVQFCTYPLRNSFRHSVSHISQNCEFSESTVFKQVYTNSGTRHTTGKSKHIWGYVK